MRNHCAHISLYPSTVLQNFFIPICLVFNISSLVLIRFLLYLVIWFIFFSMAYSYMIFFALVACFFFSVPVDCTESTDPLWLRIASHLPYRNTCGRSKKRPILPTTIINIQVELACCCARYIIPLFPCISSYATVVFSFFFYRLCCRWLLFHTNFCSSHARSLYVMVHVYHTLPFIAIQDTTHMKMMNSAK